MASWIDEFHGATPGSEKSKLNAAAKWCPFVDTECKKKQSGGACSLRATNDVPVIICPNRLYGNNFKVLAEVAQQCFGQTFDLISPTEYATRQTNGTLSRTELIVMGQGFDKEVAIPAPVEPDPVTGEPGKRGYFKVDYILIEPDHDTGRPKSIVAVEVQTIDTTDSYKTTAQTLYSLGPNDVVPNDLKTKAGFNWENVNKRILPQLIYKGHTLRRERLASFGMFFILPEAVFRKIWSRVGGRLLENPIGAGTITFRTYELGNIDSTGTRSVDFVRTYTTTVDSLAQAFVAPHNLPEMGSYETKIIERLGSIILPD